MLAGFVIVLVILAGFTVFSRSRASAQLKSDTLENALPTVSVVHPKRVPAEVKLELPGDITAFQETPIYARVSGYLKQWFTDIGTHVLAGQELAEIETPELDQELIQANAALAQARANLEIARISAERWQNLRKSDSVSQQDTTAGSSREIFRLAQIDPLRVYISLPQTYSQMVQTNDEAIVTFTELPGETFKGTVDRTAGAIDPLSRTLTTEILLSNHDGKLFPGAHAMVQVRLANGADPVIVPVNTLLFRNEHGVQAGVVDSNGIVHLADVTVGRDFGNTVEIVHGLSENDNIILNPSDSLESGTQVQVVNPETDATKAAHE